MSNLKVYAKTIEDEALEQINTLLSQDAFKDCKVRIMPDVHAGKGLRHWLYCGSRKQSNSKHRWRGYWMRYALRQFRA